MGYSNSLTTQTIYTTSEDYITSWVNKEAKLMMENYRIRENSFWAKLAAKKLNCASVAMVLGSTIHLHNTGREEFLKDERWLKHELCHIRQFRRYGFLGFLVRYIWESVRHGYYNNRFEVEARLAETL